MKNFDTCDLKSNAILNPGLRQTKKPPRRSELTLFHEPTILRFILVNIYHEVKYE